MYNKVVDIYCKDPNLLLSVFIEMVESGMNEEEALSHLYAFCPTKRAALYLRSVLPISWNNIFICPETRNSKDPSDSKEIEKYIKWIKTFDMKFDYIIQNPPYNGSLHLDFLEKGLDLLTEKGRMVIIEPATWLINVRKNGKAKKYDTIKKRIEGHVESVKIENFNKDFGTDQFTPFATMVVDLSKTYDEIEFVCCGEKKMVKSLYDCNLIGNYTTIWSIFDKVRNFGITMKEHIYDPNKTDCGNEAFFVGYVKDSQFPICQLETKRVGRSYDKSENLWIKTKNGDVHSRFMSPVLSYLDSEITNVPYKKRDQGKKMTDKIGDNIYGTKQELENWKYFVLNNKLPMFLSSCIIYDMHLNNLDEFMPWLVDKQYTDEEINKMFGFTEEEITLIDRTVKKYERNSPWFRRYICGPDSVSDEEVNNFIKNL